MKKQWTAMTLVFVLLLALTGCSTANAVQKLDAAEDRIEAKLDAAEDKLEDSIRNAVGPAPAAETKPVPTEAVPAPAATVPSAEKPQRLTEEQAVQIALDHLGLTSDQVTRLRSGFEIDDGIPQYDVEFYQGDWEYEFEIHAEDGRILSYDKDHKYD